MNPGPIARTTLLAALCALTMIAPGQTQPAAPGVAARVVLVRPAKLESLAQERHLTGTIRPRVETELAFRVTGKVIHRGVDAGQIVRAGAMLAELDRTDLDLQLRQADAERISAQAARDTAVADLDRTATLRQAGWSTQAELDKQKAAAEQAVGRHARAENAVSLARNALDYTVLRAEADAMVLVAMAEPGMVLSSGQVAFRLAHLDRLEAEVAVPESLLAAAREGQATVSLWALPGQQFPAQLREISPRADLATRTYAARFALPENAPGVTWGMTTTVRLRESPAGLGAARGALLPLAAILDEGRGPSVFIVNTRDNTLLQRPVNIARFGAEFALVIAGLAEGDLVVQLGVQKLSPGMLVRPVTRLPS